MAIVIVGGLVAATMLNLFVVPVLYLRFGRSRSERQRGRHSGVSSLRATAAGG